MDRRINSKVHLLMRILRFPLVSMLVLYFSLDYVNATGVIFTVSELALPHMGRELGIGLLLGFGLMLTARSMITRRLWMGIGLHGAWNYTMGKIFSASVSGVAIQGLIKASCERPQALEEFIGFVSKRQQPSERAAALDEYLNRWLRWTAAGLVGATDDSSLPDFGYLTAG